MPQLFENNASALITTEVVPGATQVTLTATFGAQFPDPIGDEWFIATLDDNLGNVEVIKCTSRTGDVLNVVERDVEPNAANPSPGTFPVGSRCEARISAGTMDGLLQNANDTLTGPLDADGNQIIGPSITDGETVGTPMRGATGDTSNEILVPAGGGDPTLGGNEIWHAGNDGVGSGLNADLLDDQQGTYYTNRTNHTGHELPVADNNADLGQSGLRWRNLYAVQAHLDNLDLVGGQTVNDIDSVMQGAPTNFQLLTALAIKNYIASLPQGIGTGQTWQTVSRSYGSTKNQFVYVNDTAQPIQIAATIAVVNDGAAQGWVGSSAGVTPNMLVFDYYTRAGGADTDGRQTSSFIVPVGFKYSFNNVDHSSLLRWIELR
jgi:hypothetical protein